MATPDQSHLSSFAEHLLLFLYPDVSQLTEQDNKSQHISQISSNYPSTSI